MSVHFPNFSSEHIHCKASWVILLSHQKSLCLNFTTWLQHWKGVLEKCGQPTGVDGQLDCQFGTSKGQELHDHY